MIFFKFEFGDWEKFCSHLKRWIFSSARNKPCMLMKVNFKVTKCLLPLPYWRFIFSKCLLGEGQFVEPKDAFVSKTSISFFNRAKCHHCYPWSRQCHFGVAHSWNLPCHIFQIFSLKKKKYTNIHSFLKTTVLDGRRMAFGYPVLSWTPRCCLSAPAIVAM